jgi:hypothetical protein
MIVFQCCRAAEQAHNPRALLERAEHDRNPSVLVDMRDRLAARPREVDIRRVEGAQESECAAVRALGRDIDLPPPPPQKPCR